MRYKQLSSLVTVVLSSQRFRRLLPPTDPHHITEAAAPPRSAPPPGSKRPKPLPPLRAISESFVEARGPHSFLSRCVRDRVKVAVAVRYIDRMRGTVSGFLEGFDKVRAELGVDVSTNELAICFAPPLRLSRRRRFLVANIVPTPRFARCST